MVDYKTIIRSPQFTFLVGRDRVPLKIHAGIVQDLSAPLHALITNGHMEESQTGIATLEDVDEEVFVGFCEYAYAGTYSTPERRTDDAPTSEEEESHAAVTGSDCEFENTTALAAQIASSDEVMTDEAPLSDPFDGWDTSGAAVKRKSVKRICSELWEQFRCRKFTGVLASSSGDPDILFHAKVYVFATRYLIEPLRESCIKSLHRDLCGFSLSRENASVILTLLDYTYAHTGRWEPGGKSPLRDLVIQYVACEARNLAKDKRFAEILASDAGADLVMKLVR